MGIGLVISGECIKKLADRDLEGLSMWFGSLAVQLDRGGTKVSTALRQVVDMVGSLLIALHQSRFAKKPDPPNAILDVSGIGQIDDVELMVLDGLLRGEADRLERARNSAAAALIREVMVPLDKERKRRH